MGTADKPLSKVPRPQMAWEKAVTSINMTDWTLGLKSARINISPVLIHRSAFIQSETPADKRSCQTFHTAADPTEINQHLRPDGVQTPSGRSY